MASASDPAIAHIDGLVSTYGFAVVSVGYGPCSEPRRHVPARRLVLGPRRPGDASTPFSFPEPADRATRRAIRREFGRRFPPTLATLGSTRSMSAEPVIEPVAGL